MDAMHLPALLLFQDAANMAGDLHWIMICEVILTAIVVLLLLGLAIGAAVIYSKINGLMKTVDARAQPLIAQATPLIGKGRDIMGHVNEIVEDLKPKIADITADLQPKISRISGDAQHISSLVRSKVEEVGHTFTHVNHTVNGYVDTAQEMSTKTKGQVARVNEIVSEALTTSHQVSRQIQQGVKIPVEKAVSWIAAAKLLVEDLGDKIPFFNQQGKSQQPRDGYGPEQTKRYGAPSHKAGPQPVATATPVRIVHTAADEAHLQNDFRRKPEEIE